MVDATTASGLEHRAIDVPVGGGRRVSALLDRPVDADAFFVFAHGAGAGMHHAFMAQFAEALCLRRIAVLRYQFPFVEDGSKRPDPPALAHATVRAAIGAARRALPGAPLFAGGKSFGGRMTSQAEALATMVDVQGLVFVGFPLHPAKKPSIERAAHLARVRCPMLFLQGTRDDLAELTLLRPIVDTLPGATLHLVDDADHAFHVRQSSGTNDADVLARMADVAAEWMARVARVRGVA